MKMRASLILGSILLGTVLFGAPKYTYGAILGANDGIQTNLSNGACNFYDAPAGVIEFFGNGGATNTFAMVAGPDIRDFSTCLGSGGTENVSTGSAGSYRVDEQVFTLSSDFATQEPVRIIMTDTNNGSSPIILGITASSK